MKRAISCLVLSSLTAGCAHRSKPPHAEVALPWKNYANKVAALVEQHAAQSEFDNIRESTVPPRRVRAFSEVERITGNRKYSDAERAQQQRWFHSATSVWHYTFEFQYSGILFLDASGQVQHALLLG